MPEAVQDNDGAEPNKATTPDIDATYIPNFEPMIHGRRLLPTADKVLVLEDPPKATTAGGLHIADQAKDMPATGTVEAVGPDATVEARGELRGVRPGDKVVFGLFAGALMPDATSMRHRRMLAIDEVVAILRETAPEPEAAPV